MAFIQVRNVDESLREAAKERAASLGVDLSSYVRSLIKRDLAKPTVGDWLDEALASPLGEPFDTTAAVAAARNERDEQLSRSLGEPPCS